LHSTRAADHRSSAPQAGLPAGHFGSFRGLVSNGTAGGLRRSIAIMKGEIKWESLPRTLNPWKTC
jgi:hypothetical protein